MSVIYKGKFDVTGFKHDGVFYLLKPGEVDVTPEIVRAAVVHNKAVQQMLDRHEIVITQETPEPAPTVEPPASLTFTLPAIDIVIDGEN